MITKKSVAPKDGDVVVLVGTTKGAFVFRAAPERARWQAAGPFFPGQAVFALALDARGGRNRLWAGVEHMHFGAVVCSSDNFGRKWKVPEEANVKFPEDSGLALKQIWQIVPGRADDPERIYLGVQPASLFESSNGGKSWQLVRGLHDHPHRPRWEPGGGGLCLHTILVDPQRPGRLTIAISTGGVYRSDDGGATWEVKNRGVRAEFLPDKFPEFGQCVHKIAHHPGRPDQLFLQNHWGLYRSDDGGDSWHDVANGVPSDFGFPMVAHPHRPETAYIVPLESDMFRCTPERKLRVYRTENAGASWEPLTQGLPQRGVFETILRDAMDADSAEPAGIYFGTRSGKLYGSKDGGDSWRTLHGSLPPITCVKAAVVGRG